MNNYKNLDIELGMTHLKSNSRTLTLTHAGNMGARMIDVDINVERMDVDISLKDLLTCPGAKEEGSPDYYYKLTVPVKELV